MPIQLIISSYYRQGSTVIYRMVELSNPHAIVLCEPLHPDLFDELRKTRPGEPHHLHGMPIWDGYFKLPPGTLAMLKRHHKNFTCLFNFNEVKQYLAILHHIPKPIMFKTTRMYFVLKDAKNYFKCKTIHIVRNPANTWMDFLHINIKNDENLFWKVTITKHMWREIDGAFYLGPLYQAIQRNFKAPKANDNLDKFLITWTYANYYGIMGSDVALVYEAMLKRRANYINHINRQLGSPIMSPAFAHLPNERLALERPGRRLVLNHLIRRKLEDLNLIPMYEKIYEKVREAFETHGIRNEYYPEV